MALREAIIAALVGAPLYDWIVVTGAASKMTSLDYEYWPLTHRRLASVAILSIGGFITFLIIEPPENRLWPLLPAFGAMAIHAGIALADIFRQRRES